MNQKNVLYHKFAQYFDIIYADKDYEKECDFVEAIIQKYWPYHVSLTKVLDIGCGTGEHATILAKRGYQVAGLDLSETMLAKAREKSAGLNVDFRHMDMTKFSLNEKFDVCTCLFCGICYLSSDEEIESALKCVKKILNPGGLFIFDFWSGMAVASQEPSTRVKDIKYGDHNRIIRIAEPELDIANQICNINYHFLIIEREKIIDEFEEVHPIRFFFPGEIKMYLENNGFKVIKTCSFLNQDFELKIDDWYLTVIAEAVE